MRSTTGGSPNCGSRGRRTLAARSRHWPQRTRSATSWRRPRCAKRQAAKGDEREIVQLRLAEADYFLKRPRNARDGVKPYIEKASRQGEALFFYAVATRELGDHAEYLRVVRRLVNEFPAQSWAEEALNNLATHYILQNEDESAD